MEEDEALSHVHPGPSYDEVAALARRVDLLEAALIQRGPSQSTNGPPSMQTDLAVGNRASELAHAGPSPSAAVVRLSLPSYLAATLTQAEEFLLQRDLAILSSDEALARDCDERALGLACVAMERASEELRPSDELEFAPSVDGFLRTRTGTLENLTYHEFREKELQLLKLVGLSVELAARHYDAAWTAFSGSTIVIHKVTDLMEELNRAQAAVCAVHASLVRGRRAEENRHRRRRRMRHVLTALGGTVLVASNLASAPFIGPLAVGVSGALGGGAAGAIANVLAQE